ATFSAPLSTCMARGCGGNSATTPTRPAVMSRLPSAPPTGAMPPQTAPTSAAGLTSRTPTPETRDTVLVTIHQVDSATPACYVTQPRPRRAVQALRYACCRAADQKRAGPPVTVPPAAPGRPSAPPVRRSAAPGPAPAHVGDAPHPALPPSDKRAPCLGLRATYGCWP